MSRRRPNLKGIRGLTIVEYAVAAGVVVAVGAIAFSMLGDTSGNIISSLVELISDNARRSGP